MRHAYAIDMANKGMELPELARLLGRSDQSMNYRYYNLTKSILDKTANEDLQDGYGSRRSLRSRSMRRGPSGTVGLSSRQRAPRLRRP